MVCISTRLVWGEIGVIKTLLGPRVVAFLEEVWPFMTTRSHFYKASSVLILILSSHTPPHMCPRIVGIKALRIQEYCNSLTVHIYVHTCALYPAGLHLQNTSEKLQYLKLWDSYESSGLSIHFCAQGPAKLGTLRAHASSSLSTYSFPVSLFLRFTWACVSEIRDWGRACSESPCWACGSSIPSPPDAKGNWTLWEAWFPSGFLCSQHWAIFQLLVPCAV